MAFVLPRNYPIKYGERQGQSMFSSSSIGASPYENQVNNQIIPAVNAAVNAMQLANPRVASGNAGGAFGAVAPGQSSASTTGNSSPGYYGVQVTRDPELESAVQSVLQRIQSTDLNALNRDVRSPLVGALTQQAGSALSSTINSQNQSLADFTRQFTDATPELKQITQQEVGSIGELFGGVGDTGSFASNLAAIRKQANQSLQNQLRTNLGQLTRSRSLADLNGATDSYTQRILAQEAARIMSQQALSEAELARNDELAIRGAQAGSTGRRQQLINDLVNRQLVPIEASNNLSQAQLSQIAQLAGVELPNTIIERGSEPFAREIGLLNQLLPAREAATFRGIGSNESPDLRGLGQINQPDYSGYDLDPNFLMDLLSQGDRDFPAMLDTGGSKIAPSIGANSLGNLSPQQLMQIFSEDFDYSPGSTASNLGVGGSSTIINGQEYIINPRTGALEPVGADRLTATQRLYD